MARDAIDEGGTDERMTMHWNLKPLTFEFDRGMDGSKQWSTTARVLVDMAALFTAVVSRSACTAEELRLPQERFEWHVALESWRSKWQSRALVRNYAQNAVASYY